MKISIPTNCPVCDSLLVRVNDQLFCESKTCSAKVNKLVEHFAKTLGIKGLGEKTIEKLNLESFLDLYSLTLGALADAIGEKLANKLVCEIERSKASEFATVLASMSVPLIGNTASNGICRALETFNYLGVLTIYRQRIKL